MTNETTASQPKSIGDDAQFCELLRDYMRAFNCDWTPTAEVDEKHQKFIAYIDSRAPAAQASATIQAAPEDERTRFEAAYLARVISRDPLRKYGEEEIAMYLARNSHDDSRYLHAQEAWEGWQARASEDHVATIQEPVMVAEPVDKQVQFLRGLCKAYGPKSLQYDIEHPCDGLNSEDPVEVLRVQRGQLAAPMVADPAGVAKPCGWLTGSSDHVASPMYHSLYSAQVECDEHNAYERSRPDFDAENLRKPEPVYSAATVKAVPSEALDTKRLDFMIKHTAFVEGSAPFISVEAFHEAQEGQKVWHIDELQYTMTGSEKYSNPREAIDAAMAAELSTAPLADKTGGGE